MEKGKAFKGTEETGKGEKERLSLRVKDGAKGD